MKNRFLVLFLILGMIMFSAGSSSAFLNNWALDIDGDQSGGAADLFAPTVISELLDTVGPSYIVNNFPGGGTVGTFDDFGVFSSTQHDGGQLYSWGAAAEVTGIFQGAGTVDLTNGTIGFTAGTLEIYADLAPDFATATGIYGADNGTLIGSFEVLTGDGSVDPTGVPNGQITVLFESSFLAPGYWFDESNTDLSTTVPLSFILGFATTNASFVASPQALVVSELEQFAGVTSSNTPPGDLFVSTNGQFRLDSAVPEPGTMLLLGFGLIGLAGVGRKKFFKKD